MKRARDYEPLEGALRKVLAKLQGEKWTEVPIDYLASEVGQYPNENFKGLAWRLVGDYNIRIGDKIKVNDPSFWTPDDLLSGKKKE